MSYESTRKLSVDELGNTRYLSTCKHHDHLSEIEVSLIVEKGTNIILFAGIKSTPQLPETLCTPIKVIVGQTIEKVWKNNAINVQDKNELLLNVLIRECCFGVLSL